MGLRGCRSVIYLMASVVAQGRVCCRHIFVESGLLLAGAGQELDMYFNGWLPAIVGAQSADNVGKEGLARLGKEIGSGNDLGRHGY